MKRGKLVVISGPSAGVGKDTLLKMFLSKHSDWYQPPSTTTRALREGEVAGRDMRFISDDEFKNWMKQDKFLETDYHAGNWYGTLRKPVDTALDEGTNVLLRVDVNGAIQIKNKIPEAILVFINAESFNALENRIRNRHTETEQQIVQRLDLARRELKAKDKFDFVVINRTGQQEQALKSLEQVVD